MADRYFKGEGAFKKELQALCNKYNVGFGWGCLLTVNEPPCTSIRIFADHELYLHSEHEESNDD